MKKLDLATSKPENDAHRCTNIVLRSMLAVEADLAGGGVDGDLAESSRDVVDFQETNGKSSADRVIGTSAKTGCKCGRRNGVCEAHRGRCEFGVGDPDETFREGCEPMPLPISKSGAE
jgi:hypothetical protein